MFELQICKFGPLKVLAFTVLLIIIFIYTTLLLKSNNFVNFEYFQVNIVSQFPKNKTLPIFVIKSFLYENSTM